MSSDLPPQKSSGFVLTVPMAIVLAGALIALALYFGGGGSGAPTAVNAPPAGAPAAPAAQPTPGNFRSVDSTDHVRGATNGKVTIIEYSDLECPFCKQFHATLEQVVKEYPNDVRWVYRHAPLAQLHAKAEAEANAAECAGEQGKFWEFIDLVFATTSGNDSLDLATLPDLAQTAGVANIAQFTGCVESNKYADKVQDQLNDSYVAGLRGTPYSVAVNDKGEKRAISGAQPLASVKSHIDALLK